MTPSGCVFAEGAPDVDAEIVTVLAPRGVLKPLLIVSVTVAEFAAVGCTLADEKLHCALLGNPLGHDRFTVPLNDPDAVTTSVTELEMLDCGTDTLAGDGVSSPKSTMCSITVASCVI